MKKIMLALLFTSFFCTTAQSHSVWINCFYSQAHKPPHAMVSLGFGHILPMDDILNSPNGQIAIESFTLFDPAMNKLDLRKPPFEISKPEMSNDNVDVFAADLAAQKIALKENSAKGVYQLGFISTPSFITQYIDKNGKERLKMKPRDQIDDIDKILMSVKYQSFAKSCLTLGAWSYPKPLGHGLEIIPRTDLSNLHAGDMVEVEVLFYGEPLTATAKSFEYIIADANSFGQHDKFSLFSYILQGKAQFRVQSSGQWIINVYHKDDVTKDGPLKDLHGKANQVYHIASLTFIVQ